MSPAGGTLTRISTRTLDSRREPADTGVMNATQNLNSTIKLAIEARRAINRLEDVDADIDTLRFYYATWTELAGDYADATGQSLSDAKAVLTGWA